MINIEGFEGLPPTAAQIQAYKKVQYIDLFGDNLSGGGIGQSRYDGRKVTINAMKAAGVKAEIVALPEVGLYGNTHMLMQDKNSHKVADYLIKWIGKKCAVSSNNGNGNSGNGNNGTGNGKGNGKK